MNHVDENYRPTKPRALAFEELAAEVGADRAYILLTLFIADTHKDDIDAMYMEDIRGIAKAYVKHSGQEALVSIIGKDGCIAEGEC